MPPDALGASSPRPERAAPPLVLTGERTLPDIPDERYWFERHVVAYQHAAAHLRPQDAPRILDAGCGEGYGLALLAEAGAHRVIGADLDPGVVAHAERTYAAHDPRITVLAAELMSLPLEDDEVDLTVSFQVIEHLHDVPGYLRSLLRVTRPGGTVLISTPNLLTFRPDPEAPRNPFHTREFTPEELASELTSAGLELVQLLGVHHGPRLAALEQRTGRRFTDLLTASEPASWPPSLRRTVHEVEASWFELRADDLRGCLDLIATCRVPDGARG
jgi:SAM-dependent methyltransferase